jgi:hypothetical protein
MKISCRLVLASSLLVASPTVSGKCAEGFVAFSGVVYDSSGRPLPGAQVGVSWLEGSAPRGPAIATTDANGMYRIPVFFSRYSGFSLFRGDKCDNVLTQASIAAFTATHQSRAVPIAVGSVDQVFVPDLRVDTRTQRDPLWPSGRDTSPL